MYQMPNISNTPFATNASGDVNPAMSFTENTNPNNTSIWNNPQATQSNERLNTLRAQIVELREENTRLNREIAAIQVKPAEQNAFSLTRLASLRTETETNITPSIVKEANKTQNKVLSSYGKTVSVSKLEDVYDKELSEKLAKQSKLETAGRTKSIGWCARYVNNAFEDLGLVTKNSTRCASAYMLENTLDKNTSFKRVDVSRDELKNLPAGCVVVWQKGAGFGSAFAKHGHIFITQGDGKATSDYEQDIKDYGTKFAVFVPVAV